MGGFQWNIIGEYLPLFVEGTLMTLKCTVICVIAGTLLGLVLGVGRLAEARHGFYKYFLRYAVQYPVRFYVSFFRGTPLFVQILLIHFALMPLLINPAAGSSAVSWRVMCGSNTARSRRRCSPSRSTRARMCRKSSAPASSRSIAVRQRRRARWA
jgi:His/Glu/Gln/Arg/opine family amino acid ABC transporter permease subunit